MRNKDYALLGNMVCDLFDICFEMSCKEEAKIKNDYESCPTIQKLNNRLNKCDKESLKNIYNFADNNHIYICSDGKLEIKPKRRI